MLLAAFSPCALAGTAADVQALVEAGKPVEAYQLGTETPDLLGMPDFDFFFGIAAIDAGHSPEGVLALERYLLTFPANHQARLELARGYFVLGEDARAREEFEAVLALNPPKEVVSNIERYLDAIRSRESRYQTSTRAYVEAGLGIDSNTNSGVSSGTISLPVLGPVQLGTAGTRQGDSGQLFGAGAQITQPIAPGFAVFGGVDWERKELRRKDIFDTEGITVNGGGSWIIGDQQWRATTSYSTQLVDRAHYRDVYSLGGEWQSQISEMETLSAGLQYAQILHAGANSVRDSDLTGITLGYRRALAADWQPVLLASITLANDANQRNRADLGRHLYSARIGVTFSPAPQWGLSASFNHQESRYKDEDQILLTRRLDRSDSLDLAATYLIDKAWSVRMEASFADNASNLALYEYKREAASAKLRYEFK